MDSNYSDIKIVCPTENGVSYGKSTCFGLLPDDLLSYGVMAFLTVKELCMMSCVCCRWLHLSSADVRLLPKKKKSQLNMRSQIATKKKKKKKSHWKRMIFPVEIGQRQLFSEKMDKKLDGTKEKTKDWQSEVAYKLVAKHKGTLEVLKWCGLETLTKGMHRVFHTSTSILDKRSFDKLQTLHFCNLLNITDKVIANVVSQCPRLTECSVSGCVTLTDQ
ncbi:hypothetical protein RFI_27274, partial [Reticulomyxa filosa]